MPQPNIVNNITNATQWPVENWDVFEQAELLGFGGIYLKQHSESKLRAIIAIHNTLRGPAIGGTRMKAYENSQAALNDAMLLARGMTYKSAMTDLPYGGGKAVIILPQEPFERNKLLDAYASFVEELAGQYITSVDVGTSVEDMDIIAQTTQHVVGTSEHIKGSGDPSPFTALGVCYGIEAAVEVKFQTDSLEGIHVVIQGAGHVGANLARELIQRGARVSVSDVNPDALKAIRQQLDVNVVAADEVFNLECDVFAPCALGGVINPQVIDSLKAGIVAGAANNQLQSVADGERLAERNILYAPDYIINAGGLISIAIRDEKERQEKLRNIYHTLHSLFSQAMENGEASNILADRIAEAILQKS